MAARAGAHRGVTAWGPAVVLVLTVVGTLGANGAEEQRHAVPGPLWLGVALAAAAVLPAFGAVPPTLALLGSGLLTGSYFAAGFADGPVYLAPATVAFAVAARTTPRTWAPGAAGAVLLAAAGLVVRQLVWGAPRGATPWQAIGVAALVAASGAAATALASRRVAADERARGTADAERLRMAADLHDGVGHGLAVIAMQAGAALHVLDTDPAAARTNLEAIRATSTESLDQLRAHLSRLADRRDGPGDTAARTPAPGLADVPALVERVRTGGLDVRLTLDADGGVGEAASRAAHAVVQESLTNVLRHARADRADVRVTRTGDHLRVTVVDDGRGSAPGAASAAGLGLAAMRDRVEALGGTLEAGAAPRGFTVRATIPTTEREPA